LGEIEQHGCDRQIFIPTEQIQQDLIEFAPWQVDVVTVSGSGEPTLALNLGSILSMIKSLTHRPTVVLTNGSLLADPIAQSALQFADCVAVKLDAIETKSFQRINRPAKTLGENCLLQQWVGLEQFRQQYSGKLAIQTMLLEAWSATAQDRYIHLMQSLSPDEIQLNTPTRPKPLTHELEARGNHPISPFPARSLKPVSAEVLTIFADRIQAATGIPVRIPQMLIPV
jgi:wyosine [tRNA(Phe)-imidazoG37] synthetase (radical SAM superfamily)